MAREVVGRHLANLRRGVHLRGALEALEELFGGQLCLLAVGHGRGHLRERGQQQLHDDDGHEKVEHDLQVGDAVGARVEVAEDALLEEAGAGDHVDCCDEDKDRLRAADGEARERQLLDRLVHFGAGVLRVVLVKLLLGVEGAYRFDALDDLAYELAGAFDAFAVLLLGLVAAASRLA
eukprot:3706688-Pleurochrysis_carterae.AAC.1